MINIQNFLSGTKYKKQCTLQQYMYSIQINYTIAKHFWTCVCVFKEPHMAPDGMAPKPL